MLTFAAASTLFPSKPVIAVIAATLIAFEPNTLQLNSTINNDTLLIMLSAANLLLCARLAQRLHSKTLLLLFVTVLLALLTRLAGWALLAFDLPFVVLIGLIQWRGSLRKRARSILLGGVILLLAGVAVVIFNLLNYGSLLGRYSTLEDSIAHTLTNFTPPWVTVAGVLNLTYNSYQEPLQALQPRVALTNAYGLLLLISAIGIVWALVRALIQRRRSEIQAFLLLIGFVLVAALLVIFRNALSATTENTTLYNTGFIFAPLRYYAPGLPALAVLLSAGLLAFLPERLARLHLLGVIVAGCWLLVAVIGAAHEISRQTRPNIMTPKQFAALPGLTSFALDQPVDTPQVLAYTLNEHPAEGLIDLTLYLTVKQPLARSDFAQVELTGAQGQSSLCQFALSSGTYPTTLWQPGAIIAAQAVIPNCAASRLDAPPLDTPQLRLSWLGADQGGEIVAESPPLTLASLQTTLERNTRCPDNLGMIAGGYEVTKFNSPATVHPNEPYLPSLNWIVYSPAANAAARVLVFTHADTGTTYTCSSSPIAPIYDVAQWTRGEQVSFDVCTMEFPDDAPMGDYHAAVGITDADGQYLPAVSGSGEAAANGLVTVGEVTSDSLRVGRLD